MSKLIILSSCGVSQHLWSIVIFKEDAPTPLCIPRYLDQILQRVYKCTHTHAYTARHKPFSVLRNELFISNLIIIRDEARRIVEQMDVPSWTNNNKKLVRFTTMNQTLRIIIPYIFISFPR